MKLLPLILVFLLACVSVAEEINIRVKNSSSESGSLNTLEGEKVTFLKKINSSGDGKFLIPGENLHTGFYRLTLNRTMWVDFVYDGGKINIETDAANIFDSLSVIESEANRLYYNFIRLNKSYKTKTELLQYILSRYPQDDPYYGYTQDHLNEIQNEYVEYVNITSQNDPLSFVARYIRSSQLPVVDISIPQNEKLNYLKSSALDNVNFNDAELISSNCFTNKTIEYLTYYRNPQFPKELLENEFMSAVDTILSKAKVNQLVYQHITEYLLEGFKKFGFDLVIDYILHNYVVKDDLCLNEELESSLDKRILQAQKLKVGTVVPNIVLPDQHGKEISLDKIESDKTLIVFYASWCPHCKDLMPQIAELYSRQASAKTEVLAVSMDSTLTDWKSFISQNNFTWLDVCDTQGWSSKAATDYHIYATPSMFLVDRERKIIDKPASIEDLRKHYQ
jgi:peroxiredoxin